ncbi:MAG: type II toxin-antitoxin system RelE/ParE family toxin [Rhizobiales bacterium]|nr:type II toxin-antitoxin system RelE/ParE family toxin [Hyphomicrobiales bacterium]
MITVVEMSEFTRLSNKLLTADEKRELIELLARDPMSGEVISKTGGVRKLRFARSGQGKSGSYRVIYYYYNQLNPVFLFSIYGKNQKGNISDAEKNNFFKAIQILKKGLKNG